MPLACELLARVRERGVRARADAVRAGGIADESLARREPRVARGGREGRGGVVVEINKTHRAKRFVVDCAGNVMLEGIVGVQKEVVLGSKRSIVTVEEIVDDFGPRSPNAVILPSWTVSAIAVVPGGAYPSYTFGYYKRDNAFYKQWDGIAKDRDSFLAWMKQNVLEKTPADFAVHAKKKLAAAE